jgi:hypothetical protein
MKKRSSKIKGQKGTGIKVLKSLSVFLVATIIPLVLQYLVSRPHIVVESINELGKDPLEHEFTIKNSGLTTAMRFKVNLVNLELDLEHGPHYRVDPSSKRVVFSSLSRIDDIQIIPGQSYRFPLSDFIRPNPNNRTLEASVTLCFEYHDFLHIIPYRDEISYRTYIENGVLKWKPIGPKLTKLRKPT